MPEACSTGWSNLSLDALGTIERGRSRHRPRNAEHLYGGRYPFIQTGDVKAAGLRVTASSQTYSDAGLAQSRLWPVGTLCITIAANICDTAILGIEACFPDSIVGFTADSAKCDAVFVKYALDQQKERFSAIAKGTTQENLSVEKMLTQCFPVPPLPEQRRIASILSAYDDLIEVNRRRVAILEEMARRLFEEWFVNLRFPGHETVPVHDAPDGRVPDGWQSRPFSAVASFINGYAFKPGDWSATGTPIIKIRELKDGVAIATPRFEGLLDDRYRVAPGALLFSWSAHLDAYIWPGGEGWLNQHLFLVNPDVDVGRAYLFHALRHAMPKFQTRANGATMHHIKRSALDQVTLLLPPQSLLNRFADAAETLLDQRVALVQATHRLTAARDLLLPRLVSGELSVAHAPIPDRLLEAAD